MNLFSLSSFSSFVEFLPANIPFSRNCHYLQTCSSCLRVHCLLAIITPSHLISIIKSTTFSKSFLFFFFSIPSIKCQNLITQLHFMSLKTFCREEKGLSTKVNNSKLVHSRSASANTIHRLTFAPDHHCPFFLLDSGCQFSNHCF